MQYTKEGLKEPKYPKLSSCNFPSYRDIEEPKPPTLSQVLNHPTIKKLLAINSKRNPEIDCLHSPVNDQEENHGSDHDSTSSFIFNESTIIETCDKPSNHSSSSKKRLSKILKESHKRDTDNVCGDNNRPKIHLQNSTLLNFTQSMQKDRYQNTTKMPNIKSDFLNLNMLINDLSEQKNIVDLKFQEYEKEKDTFNTKWENILRTVKELNWKYNDSSRADVASLSDNLNTLKFKGTSSARRKSGARVISSKINKSISKTPLRSSFNSPNISGMLQLKAAKTYTDLRANYSLLKTPVGSAKKKAMQRSSCYTPHSLSMCIGNQVRDIFGS
jgi:hypothetical protein